MPPAKTKNSPKSTNRSESSLKPKITAPKDIRLPCLDQIEVRILGLWMSEQEPPHHAIKVSFADQLLVSSIIKPFGLERWVDESSDRVFAKGNFTYDPADIEKMGSFADMPLVVNVQPLKPLEDDIIFRASTPTETTSSSTKDQSSGTVKSAKEKGKEPKSVVGSSPHPPTQPITPRITNPKMIPNISCCNIDILPLFLDQDSMCVRKRLQPMLTPNCLQRKSWDNLPLLVLSISAWRHPDNKRYHQLLQNSNWMKITVVGAYNLLTPYNPDCYYTAASKIPSCNEMETKMVMFCEGTRVPRKFKCENFFPRWETLRLDGELFCKTDTKIKYDFQDVTNQNDIELEYYIKHSPQIYNTIWGSFHRGLLVGDSEQKLWHHLRQWKWPLEVHFYGDLIGGFSFMAFMDLFPLLYPGMRRLVLAIPLVWFNVQLMFENCNSGVLLAPNDKQPFAGTPVFKVKSSSRVGAGDSVSSVSEDIQGTGADDNPAFILVEVLLDHPMTPEVPPPYISSREINAMLNDLEPEKGSRHAHMRDPSATDCWLATLRNAKHALRRVPYLGTTDMCEFNRHLNETRARVEITTSFFLEAAKYVNNNFLVTKYLEPEEVYEEMLMMAHVSMMKKAVESLVGKDDFYKIDGAIRAARHARQMNDLAHASEMYMLATVRNPFDADCWRELATCLQDIDGAWAEVCLNKALDLNIRHPLTILSKGCMVFEKDPDGAEPFFLSLCNLFPFWPTAYIICIAYTTYRELFLLADLLKESLADIREQRLASEQNLPRAWERELGDFWEPSALLPGMNSFLDAADLLLRIRATRMAEVCLGLVLAESGPSATYFHHLGISCRLQGKVEDALCFVNKAVEMFGQDAALRCLEGECYHYLEDTQKSLAAFEKVKGGGSNPNSVLMGLPCLDLMAARKALVELLRRHPSAYAWMALADDWMKRSQIEDNNYEKGSEPPSPPARECAAACAVQALKWDRRAGRAWALLSKLVKPLERRTFCANMAADCGYGVWTEPLDMLRMGQKYKDPPGHLLATAIKDCRCAMCEKRRI